MIISCDFCGTTFKLADDKIKTGKIKLKCAKCKKIFEVRPNQTETRMPAEAITPDESETLQEEPDTSENSMINLPPEKTEDTTQNEPEETFSEFDQTDQMNENALQTKTEPAKTESDEPEPPEEQLEQEDTTEDFIIDLPDETTEESAAETKAEDNRLIDELIGSDEAEGPSLGDVGNLDNRSEAAEESQKKSDIAEDFLIDLPGDNRSKVQAEEELMSLDDIGSTDDNAPPPLDNVENFDDSLEEKEEITDDSDDSENFFMDQTDEESTQSDDEVVEARLPDKGSEIGDNIFPSFDDFGDLDADLGATEKSQDEEESIFDSADFPDLDMPGDSEQDDDDDDDDEIDADKVEADHISSIEADNTEDEAAIDEEGFMWDESDSSESDSSDDLFDGSDEGDDSFDFESDTGDIDEEEIETDVPSPPEDAFKDEQNHNSSPELELDEQAAPPEISEGDVDVPLAHTTKAEKIPSSISTAEIEPVGEIKRSNIGIIIALLVLIISLGGAFYYVISSGKNITLFGIDLKKTLEKYDFDLGAPGISKIEITNLKGYYFQVKKEGMIFVVEGNAVNNDKKPRSFIRVKGNLYDSKGLLVMSKEAYGGNILTRNDLRDFPKEKVLKEMDYRVGKGLINSNIATGKKIPFMVVFYGVPDNLSEFDIEVVSSEDATKS